MLPQPLCALPVAHQAARRKHDGLHLVGLELLRERGRRVVSRLGADALHGVLRNALHRSLAARVEVALHRFGDFARGGLGENRARGQAEQD
jgi:hypothetical protein